MRAYPGLAAAAGGLATPQIRHLATVGGNLAQRSRCWYFRNPHFDCFKKGGSDCPSRTGNHLYGVAFDLGPCVAPHPSTLAAALLAYDATVATSKRSSLSILQLLGEGKNASSDHALQPGEVIKSIQLPPALAGERAFYKRAISRTYAEWPLVELVVRAVVSGGKFEAVYVAAGGIAPVPLRLDAVERAVDGRGRDHRDGGRCRKAGDRRRKPAADDRLQARSPAGPRARSAGQVCGLGQGSYSCSPRHCEERSDEAIQRAPAGAPNKKTLSLPRIPRF